MHYLLFYELVDDYVARRAEFRSAHLEKAWAASGRDELVLGGALAEPVDRAVLPVPRRFAGPGRGIRPGRSVRDQRPGAPLVRARVEHGCRSGGRDAGVAAGAGVSGHVHIRNGVAGLDSTLAAARAMGLPLHVVHANSSAGPEIAAFLEMIAAARDAGQDVTTETYPYGAGMTEIQSALVDDWESRSGAILGAMYPLTVTHEPHTVVDAINDHDLVAIADELAQLRH